MNDRSEGSRPVLSRVRRGVIGVLRSGDELLAIRRAAGIAKGGCWCFPGGHLEYGETSRMAVVRELREELGIDVEPVRRLGSVRVLDSRHVLAVWEIIQVGAGQIGGGICPAESEIAEVRWMTANGLREIQPSLPSNARVLAMLGV